jgi:hypothetical protein
MQSQLSARFIEGTLELDGQFWPALATETPRFVKDAKALVSERAVVTVEVNVAKATLRVLVQIPPAVAAELRPEVVTPTEPKVEEAKPPRKPKR